MSTKTLPLKPSFQAGSWYLEHDGIKFQAETVLTDNGNRTVFYLYSLTGSRIQIGRFAYQGYTSVKEQVLLWCRAKKVNAQTLGNLLKAAKEPTLYVSEESIQRTIEALQRFAKERVGKGYAITSLPNLKGPAIRIVYDPTIRKP